ncbi:MAG: methyltransferase [Magnetococcales bacterium]|nr:methyltransferase [Magnetococcales bacterium]
MMKAFAGFDPGVCRRVGGGGEGRLLAGLVRAGAGKRVAELGCGCGEVAIRVALAHPEVRVDALELRERLCVEARRLVEVYGVGARVRVLTGDVRALPDAMTSGHYAEVLCNPPFFSPRSGRLPPDPDRAAARFELMGGLEDFIRAAVSLLEPGGSFHLIHRPERLTELLSGCVRHGLQPWRLVPVHDRPDRAAVLVLLSARKGSGGSGLILEAAQGLHAER